MEGRSWKIFRGFVVRIPSAPITASEEVETCRCVIITGRISSVACLLCDLQDAVFGA